MIQSFSRFYRTFAASLLLLLGGGTVFGQMDFDPFADISAGPLFDKVGLTLESGVCTDAVGPFYYRQETPEATQWAVPPFYAEISQPGVDAFNCEVLPPVFSYHRFGRESTTLITPLINIYGGRYQNNVEYRRAMVFPFYYRQVCTDPSKNYFALFPFYGTIKNKFLRNEIHFTMFPVYGQSRKRDVVTDNFLYPLFHTRTGNGLTGWQFWPLVGLENKIPTTRTNMLGNVEVVGGHEKLFLVWPIFFDETTGIGTDRRQYYQSFWPAYTSLSSPQRSSTSFLYPMFTYTEDRENKYREYDFPWPLFVIARGEGKTITRFFPIYNFGRTESLSSEGFLWPVYMHRLVKTESLLRDKHRWLIYGLIKVDETNRQTGEKRRRLDSLPLFTYRRGWDGRERLQVGCVLEPLLPDSDTVERVFSPLWSLYVSERNPTNNASSQSLLWNFYRHDSSPQMERTSFFFGLFQHRKTAKEDLMRIFFIPFRKQPQSASANTTANRPSVSQRPKTGAFQFPGRSWGDEMPPPRSASSGKKLSSSGEVAPPARSGT